MKVKIKDEFINKVQTEKIAVVCNTKEEVIIWYNFLDKHMDIQLLRYGSGEEFYWETLLGKAISNNTQFRNVCEYSSKEYYINKGYEVYNFKDIIENSNIQEQDSQSEQNEPKEYLIYVKNKQAPKKVHTEYSSVLNEAKRLSKINVGNTVYIVEVKQKFKSKVIVEEV